MDLGLRGRRAIVFGSTAGLGKAIAETLAAEGAVVAISGRRAELAADIAASLPGAVAVVGDLTVDGEPARSQAVRATAEGITADAVRARHQASIPMGRFGWASELADVVTFLCSARASFVAGSVVRVDGGAVIGY